MSIVYIECDGSTEGYVFKDENEAIAFANQSKMFDNDCRTTTIKKLEV